MNKFTLILLLAASGFGLWGSDAFQYDFQVYRSRIVTDSIPGAVAPSGIVVNSKGEWLTTFGDKGDVNPGCRVYFIKSTDQGETWSRPYRTMTPEQETDGLAFNMYNLPDGRILGIKSVFQYVDRNATAGQGRLGSYSEVMISGDDGETFEAVGKLKTPPSSLISLMNSLTVLNNGDLLLPCYILPIGVRYPDAVYGSGFYRSCDGGKTWGNFELAFREDQAQPMAYNESALVQKADGTVVGFARVDRTQSNNMWKVVSTDNGKSWSSPVETAIPGHWPEIKRLDNGLYLMVCGYFIRGGRRKTVFYLSDDGENFTRTGTFKYSRPVDDPKNGFGGGVHSLMPVGKNSAYVLTYGWDFDLTADGWYLDGCMVKAETNK